MGRAVASFKTYCLPLNMASVCAIEKPVYLMCTEMCKNPFSALWVLLPAASLKPVGDLFHWLSSTKLSIFPELSQNFDSSPLISGEKILQSTRCANVSKREQCDWNGFADLLATLSLKPYSLLLQVGLFPEKENPDRSLQEKTNARELCRRLF